MFKALLLSIWYDLSDVKLAEALDDRASFRRFCGFSSGEPTPERTAFVRFRRTPVKAGLDRALLEAVNAQLKAKAIGPGAKSSKAGANRLATHQRKTPPTAWGEGVLFGCGGRI